MSEHYSNETFRRKYRKLRCDIVKTFDNATAADLLAHLAEEPQYVAETFERCRDGLAKEAAGAFSQNAGAIVKYWKATEIAGCFERVSKLIQDFRSLTRINDYNWAYFTRLVRETNWMDQTVSAEKYTKFHNHIAQS